MKNSVFRGSLGTAGLLILVALLGQDASAQAPAVADNHERLPYHLDSIIALVLFGYASLVALMMNHARPGRRAFGIALAAVGCFGVSGGIWALELAGQFAELRPPRFSIDPSKPIVMHVMALVFLAAGIVLAFVSSSQTKRTDELALGNGNEPSRYGLISRYFHWTIAVLFVLLVPMGTFTTMIPYDVEYRQVFYVIHKSLGLTVFLLAGARIVWLWFSPPPGLSAGLSGWERFLAHGAHYALYFFLFAFPISGFVLSTSLGKLSHFFIWDTPMFWGPDEPSLAISRWIHKLILPFTFYLVIIGHVLGALKHQYVDRHEESFRRMVT